MPTTIDEATVFVPDLDWSCTGRLWAVDASTLLRISQKNIYEELCNAPQPHEIWGGARDWLKRWVRNLEVMVNPVYLSE